MNKLIATAIILSIAFIIGLISVYFMGNDNPVEEACEEIIKDETGVVVDLTPAPTPEATNSVEKSASS